MELGGGSIGMISLTGVSVAQQAQFGATMGKIAISHLH